MHENTQFPADLCGMTELATHKFYPEDRTCRLYLIMYAGVGEKGARHLYLRKSLVASVHSVLQSWMGGVRRRSECATIC